MSVYRESLTAVTNPHTSTKNRHLHKHSTTFLRKRMSASSWHVINEHSTTKQTQKTEDTFTAVSSSIYIYDTSKSGEHSSNQYERESRKHVYSSTSTYIRVKAENIAPINMNVGFCSYLVSYACTKRVPKKNDRCKQPQQAKNTKKEKKLH